MAHRIQRFEPLQTAKVLGILYAIMGAVVAPFFILATMLTPEASAAGLGIGFAIALPLLYGLFGALATAIGCLLYNLVASWVGGIEVDLDSASLDG